MSAADPMPSLSEVYPDLAHAGPGIASAFAYLSGRARWCPAAPQTALTVAGRYVLRGKLGAGAMGVVFTAFDETLGRVVALKVLRAPDDAAARSRLQQEARRLAKLSHPNVVQVYDTGESWNEVYLAMEYVEGLALDAWIEKERPTAARLFAVFLAVGRGLMAAHAKQIVHRDIKPANILVDAAGRAWLTDFGLAATDDPNDPTHPRPVNPDDRLAGTLASTLSRSGEGTPLYMAPEQFADGGYDERTDLFGFCVVMWEAVYGQRPFAAATLAECRRKVCSGEITPPATRPRGVSTRLERLLRRGLAPDPGDRIATMGDLLAELERLDPRRSSRAVLVGLGLGVLVGGAAAWMVTPDQTGACVTERVAITEVWPADRAATLVAALPTSDQAAVRKLVAPVDAFAAALGSNSVALCERHRDGAFTAVQYHRGQRCLRDRLAALRVVAAALPEPGAGAYLLTPADVQSALGPLARCLDPVYLATEVEPPTHAQAQGVSAVEASRSAGETVLLQGRFADAAAQFAEAAQVARSVGHAPTTAAALLDVGRAELRLRHGAGAMEALLAARVLADSAGDTFMAADVSLLLAHAAVVTNDLQAARWYEEEALAWLHRTGRDDGGLVGELELTRAARLLREGDPEAARRALVSAADRLRRDPLPFGLWTVNLPQLRAEVATLTGDVVTARAETAAADERLAELVGGGEHPLRLEAGGRAARIAGDLEAARRDLEQAREIYVRLLGPHSLHLASVDVELARTLDALGRADDALGATERADAVLRQAPDEPAMLDERLHVAGLLGREYIARGELERAFTAFEAGLAERPRTVVPGLRPSFAMLAAGSADCLNLLREPVAARLRIAEALRMLPEERRETVPGPASHMLRVAADLALDSGDRSAAQRYADEALRLLASHPLPDRRARVLYTLAQALGCDEPRALPAASEAGEYFARTEQRANAAEVRSWVAGCEKQRHPPAIDR